MATSISSNQGSSLNHAPLVPGFFECKEISRDTDAGTFAERLKKKIYEWSEPQYFEEVDGPIVDFFETTKGKEVQRQISLLIGKLKSRLEREDKEGILTGRLNYFDNYIQNRENFPPEFRGRAYSTWKRNLEFILLAEIEAKPDDRNSILGLIKNLVHHLDLCITGVNTYISEAAKGIVALSDFKSHVRHKYAGLLMDRVGDYAQNKFGSEKNYDANQVHIVNNLLRILNEDNENNLLHAQESWDPFLQRMIDMKKDEILKEIIPYLEPLVNSTELVKLIAKECLRAINAIFEADETEKLIDACKSLEERVTRFQTAYKYNNDNLKKIERCSGGISEHDFIDMKQGRLHKKNVIYTNLVCRIFDNLYETGAVERGGGEIFQYECELPVGELSVVESPGKRTVKLKQLTGDFFYAEVSDPPVGKMPGNKMCRPINAQDLAHLDISKLQNLEGQNLSEILKILFMEGLANSDKVSLQKLPADKMCELLEKSNPKDISAMDRIKLLTDSVFKYCPEISKENSEFFAQYWVKTLEDISFFDKNGNTILHELEKNELPADFRVACINAICDDEKFENKISNIIHRPNQQGYTPFMLAAENGDTEVVRDFLKKSATAITSNEQNTINKQDPNSKTALILAAENGHTEVVKQLLAAGADADLSDSSYTTALMRAAQNGHTQIVRHLLENGVKNINQQNRDGKTALILAAENGHIEIITALLENGAKDSINEKDKEGQSALLWAAQNGHVDAVSLLLEHKATVDARSLSNETALIAAAKNGHIGVVNLLIEAGAKTGARNSSRETALLLAVKNEHIEVVQRLMEAKVRLDIKDSTNIDALMLAVETGNIELVTLLVDAGANVNARDENNYTPLMRAVRKGDDLLLVQYLLGKGADKSLHEKDKYGLTTLMFAILGGNLEVVKEILKHDVTASINERTFTNQNFKIAVGKERLLVSDKTALSWTIELGHEGIMPLLLAIPDIKARLNQIDCEHKTPLMRAAAKGKLSIVESLVESGALVDIKEGGETALIAAIENGHTAVVEYLLKNKAQAADGWKSIPVRGYVKQFPKFSEKLSPLMLAAQTGNLEIVKLLVKNGADPTLVNDYGRSALMFAAQRGRLSIVKYLLSDEVLLANVYSKSPDIQREKALQEVDKIRHAQIRQESQYGPNIFMLAVESRNLDVVRYLLELVPEEQRREYIQEENATSQETAFMIAVRNGDERMVEFLLQNIDKKHILAQTSTGRTALMYAAQNNHLVLVYLLLKELEGIDPAHLHAEDNDGETAFTRAAKNGHKLVMEYLLKNGAQANHAGKEDETALISVALSGNLPIVKSLLENKNDAKKSLRMKGRGESFTPLMAAARYGKLPVVRYLLENNLISDIDDQDKCGMTALMLILRHPPEAKSSIEISVEIVKHLIQHKADVNKKNNENYTPLMLVAEYNHPDLVACLLNHMEEKHIHDENNDKKTAFMLAKPENRLVLLEYWKEKKTVPPDINAQDAQGWTPLMIAARSGRLSLVQYLLEKGANVNQKSTQGETALNMAAEQGHAETVQYLLKKGADINQENARGLTSLMIAAESTEPVDRLLPVVECLLANEACSSKKNASDETVLMLAVAKGKLPIVRRLLLAGDARDAIDAQNMKHQTALSLAAHQRNVDIVRAIVQFLREAEDGEALLQQQLQQQDLEGHTALMQAAMQGNIEVVECLLKNGAAVSLEAQDMKHKTALMLAVEGGHIETVEYLFEKGALIDKKDINGKTPLMLAVEKGHLEMVECLLEKGARADEEDIDGKTALILAVETNQIGIVQCLLDKLDKSTKDRIVNQRSADGQTALQRAVEQGRTEIVKLLIEHQADVNTRDAKSLTLLMKSIIEKHLPVMECLLAAKARVDDEDLEGRTALMLAVEMGDTEMVERLLEAGAYVDASDKEKVTPLMRASGKDNAELVTLLIEHEANVNARDLNGKSPLIWAAENGRTENATLLIGAGADRKARDSNGATLIMCAAANGWMEFVKQQVVDNPGNEDIVNAMDNDNSTALMQAAFNCHESVVQYLGDNGAHIDARDKDRKTVLMWAIDSGFLGVVKYLIKKGESLKKRLVDLDEESAKGETVFTLGLEKHTGPRSIAKYLLKHIHKSKVNRLDINTLALSGQQQILVWVAEHGGGDVGFVKRVIEQGAHLDAANPDGQTALMGAASKGYSQIVEHLIEKKARIAGNNKKGETVLILAASHGDVQMLELILTSVKKEFEKESGEAAAAYFNEYVQAQDVKGQTALMRAVQGDTHSDSNIKVMDTLLEVADKDYINAENASDETALMVAMRRSKKPEAKHLLEKGARIAGNNTKGETILMFAAAQGDTQLLELILKCAQKEFAEESDEEEAAANLKKYIQTQNSEGWTALMLAAGEGHLSIVETLLPKVDKDHVRVTARNGKTTLMAAARCGKIDSKRIVESLLPYVAEHLHAKDETGQTVLMAAAEEGHVETLEFLAEKVDKEHINEQRKDGKSALMLAAARGNLRKAQCLVDKGADICAQDKNGWTVLSLPFSGSVLASNTFTPNIEMVKYLLKNGAEIDKTDTNDRTILMLVIEKEDQTEIVKYLLSQVSQQHIQAQAKNGQNSFMLAVKKGSLPIVECLLSKIDKDDRESYIGTRNSNGRSAFTSIIDRLLTLEKEAASEEKAASMAAETKWGVSLPITPKSKKGEEKQLFAMMEYLLKHDAATDIDQPDAQGRTPLMWAVQKGQLSSTKLLLEKGANVNATSHAGETALTLAIRNRQIEVVKHLLDKKAKVTHAALIWAAKSGSTEIVECLLKKMTRQEVQDNINKKDGNGQTLLMCAAQYGGKAMLELILQGLRTKLGEEKYLQCLKEKNATGQTPFMLAAINGNNETVKLLFGLDESQLYATDNDGKTSLMKAAEHGRIEVADFLLEHLDEAQIYAKANDGSTVLILATEQRFTELVEHLLRKTKDRKNYMIIDNVGRIAVRRGMETNYGEAKRLFNDYILAQVQASLKKAA